MADEHYRWLDRDVAERLLRGESLEAVDVDTREQADRLARALGALAADPPPGSTELPGEAAALAAFRETRGAREAREGRNGEAAELGHRGLAHSVGHASDAVLVRLGRPAAHGRRGGPGGRWGRPARFGIAAALAAGMLGGVAVAAGTGVLPTPFGDERPGPAASVTAAGTPQRPLVSPSSGVSGNGGSGTLTPDGTTGGPSDEGSGSDEVAGGAGASGQPGSDSAGGSGRTSEWWTRTRSYCRDVLDGKDVAAGHRRVLEDAAGGGGKVKSYCAGVLARAGGGSGADEGAKTGSNKGNQGDEEDQGDQGDQGGDDDGHHIGRRGNNPHGNGSLLTPSPSFSALSPLLPSSAHASPSPTHSASASLVKR